MGADIHITNKNDENALDLSVVRVAYETAVYLKKQGLETREVEFYHQREIIPFDTELFIEKVNKEEEITSYKIFYERIEREEKEWEESDLVIDPRETWKV